MSGYWSALCLCAALSIAPPLFAAENDPPGRIGRLSLATEGTRLRIGDSVASGGAALNWPLTTGAAVETSADARAEARIGSTTLRIDGNSSLEFVELDDERIRLRLNRGSVILEVRSPEHAAGLALETPQARLRFDAPGTYRGDVSGGTTAVSAYSGATRIDDLSLTVRAGDRILLLGSADRNYLLGQAANDAFRQWSLARAQNDDRGTSRYVPPEMTGHEELDRHGSWRETAEYGPAWFPQDVPVGWAPYRWGRWAWVPPWGWTWIDHAPWGFAPSHYGRWALVGGRWAWLPGAYAARPVYAPALVVWLGQPGWSASFSFGAAPAIGWYPLGPREAYYPHYRSSTQHVRNLNVSHVVNITRIESARPPSSGHESHVHRHRHEAVTIVPEKMLKSGATVDRSAILHDPHAVSSAPVLNAPPPQGKPLDEARTPGRPAVSGAHPLHAGSPPAQSVPDHPVPSAPKSEVLPRPQAEMPAALARPRPAPEPIAPARPSYPSQETRPAPFPPVHAAPLPRPQAAAAENGRHHDPHADRVQKEREGMPIKAKEQSPRDARNKQGMHDR